MATFQGRTAASANDGRVADPTGTPALAVTATTLPFGRYGAGSANDGDIYMRWAPAITITAGQRIVVDSAYISFIAGGANTAAMTVNIEVISQASYNCAALSGSVWNWTTGATPVGYTPESWASGSSYNTPDISALAQEWFDAVGAHCDTYYVGIKIGHDSCGDNVNRRPDSWDLSGHASGPQLNITYHIVTDITVTIPALDGDLDIPVPSVDVSGLIDVTAPDLEGTLDIPIPGIASGVVLTAPALEGDLDIPVPTVTVGALINIAVPAIEGTLDVPAPPWIDPGTTNLVFLSDGTTGIKDVIHNLSAVTAGTPTTASLFNVDAPVLSATAYTKTTYDTAALGMLAGQPLTFVFVVNTTWAGDDSTNHYLFDNRVGATTNGVMVYKSNANALYARVYDANGNYNYKYISTAYDNWLANVDHVIVVQIAPDNTIRIWLDGQEGNGKGGTGGVRESAIRAEAHVGTNYANAYPLGGSILCAIYGRILAGPLTAGMISMTFDNGVATDYTEVMGDLDGYDFPGTFWIITDRIDSGSYYMTTAQLQALYADGPHEIGSHSKTHPEPPDYPDYLLDLSREDQDVELADSKSWLETNITGVGNAKNFATPGGISDATLRADIMTHYRSHRTIQGPYGTGGYFGGQGAGFDVSQLNSWEVWRTNTLATITEQIQDAVSLGQWLVFCYHDIDNTYGGTHVVPSVFLTHLDAMVDSGLSVLTVDDALDIYIPGLAASELVVVCALDDWETLLGNVEVTVPAIEGTLDIPAPAVDVAGGDPVTVTVPALDGNLDVTVPTISAGASVTVPALEGALDVPIPTVAAGAAIIVPALDGNLDIPVPAVGSGALVTVLALDGTLDIPSPTVEVSGAEPITVTVPALEGDLDIPSPTVTAGVVVTTPPVEGSLDIPTPTVSAGANVTAPSLDGTLDIPVPGVLLETVIVVPVIEGVLDIPLPSLAAGVVISVPTIELIGDIPVPVIAMFEGTIMAISGQVIDRLATAGVVKDKHDIAGEARDLIDIEGEI